MVQHYNKKAIAILMSTYNGEKYVGQQIESILSQTCQDYTLYIRDDCSNDRTSQIIEKYALNNSNIVFIKGEKNLGSKKSFLHLLFIVNSQYYMFSDQDDVWKSNKILSSFSQLKKLEKINITKSIIVHTDLHLVDKNLQTISESYWKYCKLPVDMPHDFYLHCHFNYVTGCAMMFNEKVKELIKPYYNIDLPYHIHHDKLLSLLVSKNKGIIYPVHISTIYFRRHDNNETNPLIKNKSIFSKLHTIFSYINDQYKRYRFYNTFEYGSFIKYMYYKYKSYKLIKIWKKKLE